MFDDLTFKNPELFYLFLLLLPMVAWYVLRYRKNSASIRIPGSSAIARAPVTLMHYLRHLPFLLQMAAISSSSWFWHGPNPPPAGKTSPPKVST